MSLLPDSEQAVEQYLEEVRELSLVSADEAVKLLAAARAGDNEALQRTMESLLLVTAILGIRLAPPAISRLGAIQEANSVLLRLINDATRPDPAIDLAAAIRESWESREIDQPNGLPKDILLRPWNESDFPAIQRLSAAEGWPTPTERPEAALQSWRHSWPALVAEANGEITGFVRAVSDGAVTTYVAELLVVPDRRGQGVGRALLAVAQSLCPGARLDLLAVGQSRAFYERLGFRPFAGYRRSWAELEKPLDTPSQL